MLLFYHYFFSFNSVTIKREKKEYIKINGDHVDKPGMIFPVCGLLYPTRIIWKSLLVKEETVA